MNVLEENGQKNVKEILIININEQLIIGKFIAVNMKLSFGVIFR